MDPLETHIFNSSTYRDFTFWHAKMAGDTEPTSGTQILQVTSQLDFDRHEILDLMAVNLRETAQCYVGQLHVIFRSMPYHSPVQPGLERVGIAGSRDPDITVVTELIQDIVNSQHQLRSHLDDFLNEFYTGGLENQPHDFESSSSFTGKAMLLCRIVQDPKFRPTFFILSGLSEGIKSAGDDTMRLMLLIATTIEMSQRVRWIVALDDNHWSGLQSLLATLAPVIPAEKPL